ncbi:Hsp20 family protein [Sphingomonas panacisoli]|uniref:Hsp20 family protein n=1 Tax=Sphingomonas panacisoli TaxID=1813879 RepID=A0A5B8LF53_9SPHN|nr:Hsp20 family protein [Sphingomonas panacisoli]QDZ06858.1 Hsp20 family protein [Sphingomonas panacisoli]
MRTNFDFTPYRRSTVGFDRLFDLLETSARADTETYPPFDIEQQGEDQYRITLAVAGFRPDEIEIVAQNNQLTVTGKRKEEADTGRYLHRGIATRAFERRFQLADFVVVEDASFDSGLLRISLKREIPEAMKPRKIEISATVPAANDRLEAPSEANRQAA